MDRRVRDRLGPAGLEPAGLKPAERDSRDNPYLKMYNLARRSVMRGVRPKIHRGARFHLCIVPVTQFVVSPTPPPEDPCLHPVFHDRAFRRCIRCWRPSTTRSPRGSPASPGNVPSIAWGDLRGGSSSQAAAPVSLCHRWRSDGRRSGRVRAGSVRGQRHPSARVHRRQTSRASRRSTRPEQCSAGPSVGYLGFPVVNAFPWATWRSSVPGRKGRMSQGTR